MSNYYVIYFGDDGISISKKTKAQVQREIDILTKETSMEEPFVTSDDREFYMDGGEYPENKHMIIKGELVVPKPVEIIKKYEI